MLKIKLSVTTGRLMGEFGFQRVATWACCWFISGFESYQASGETWALPPGATTLNIWQRTDQNEMGCRQVLEERENPEGGS